MTSLSDSIQTTEDQSYPLLVEATQHLRAIVDRLRQDDEWAHIYDGHAQDLTAAINWLGEHERNINAGKETDVTLPAKSKDRT